MKTNDSHLTVFVSFRKQETGVRARLEFEGVRAFAVLDEYWPKGAKEVVGKEKVELDVRFLHKIEGAADYIYTEEIELPDYGKN